MALCFASTIRPDAAIAKTNPKDSSINYQCDTKKLLPVDDYAQQARLPYSLGIGGKYYNKIYISPNGFISFDWFNAESNNFPTTPNISIAVYDWVTFYPDTYITYGTTDTTLCIVWNVKPYGKPAQSPTKLTLKILLYNSTDWSGYVETEGWLPNTVYRGIRASLGSQVVEFTSLFNIGSNGAPEPTKECWNKKLVPVSDDCEPTPAPIEKTRQITCSGFEPVSGGSVTWEATLRYKEYWDGRTEDIDNQTDLCAATDKNLENVDAIVTLDNGVELTYSVAQALKVFNTPSAAIKAIFTDPAKFVKALSNVGADMSPEVRKKAQQALVPAVIVSQVVSTTSAVTLLRK